MSDEAWEHVQQNHRSFPLKSNRKGRRTFDPRNSFGTYEIQCPTIQKSYNVEMLTLDIHCTNDDHTAMQGSFDFGVLVGMMLVAGSRSKLAEAISEADEEYDHCEDGNEEEDAEGAESVIEGSDEHYRESITSSNLESSQNALHDDNETNFETTQIAKHSRSFEKNTFRNPKFWFQWRGIDKSSNAIVADPSNTNRGFIEFSSNACKDFRGTFSSELLGRDIAIQGFKVRSKNSPCPYSWIEFR